MFRFKKWAFVCAAAAGAALIGCGGSHSSSNSNPGTGTTSTTSGNPGRPLAATVNLNNAAATVIVSYLTGVARDDGDLHMVIRNGLIHDSSFNLDYQNSNNSPLDLDLNQYQIEFMDIDVPKTQTSGTDLTNSEQFDFFTLNPFYFAIESGGTIPQDPSSPGAFAPDPFIAANPIPVRLRTFPGRDSILPVFLDFTMFQQNGNVYSYNGNQFQTVNQPQTNDPSTSGKMVGFLSDFIQFNIGTHYWQGGTANPIAPNSTYPQGLIQNPNGQPAATHFYMSGDAYAFSNDTVYDPSFPAGQTVPPYITKGAPPSGFFDGDGVLGQSGVFEQLTLNPTQPYDGLMDQPGTQPPDGGSSIFQNQQGASPNINFPGTYDLLQANPTDISGISKIVSTYGRWRNINTVAVLQNTKFDIIIFPNSSDLFTEDTPADAVAFSHTVAPDGSVVITNLYAGYAFLTGTGGDKPVVRVYPLGAFVQGATTGELDFDLTKYTGSSGGTVVDNRSVRNGTYTFDTAQSSGALPTGFQNTGTFVVFRS